jgi:Rad3-related DNA helicase
MFNKSGAVNALCQGIDRSVRSVNDKVIIVLFDVRLTNISPGVNRTSRWREYLPSWINPDIVNIEQTPTTTQQYWKLFLKIYINGY